MHPTPLLYEILADLPIATKLVYPLPVAIAASLNLMLILIFPLPYATVIFIWCCCNPFRVTSVGEGHCY